MLPVERAARAVFAAIGSGDFDAIRDLVTADFVDHGAPPGLVPPGPDGYIATLRFVRDVLRVRYEMHETVAAGDLFAARATIHGVHNSDHLGFPATGRPYAMATMHMYRAEGDRLAEHWGVRDELGALWEAGALPRPPMPAIPLAR